MRAVRTPFLATRPATTADYFTAAGVLLLLLAIAGAIAPFASSQGGPGTDLMTASFTAAVVCQAITAFLLYGQWRAGRHASVGFLAIAFAFSALLITAFWMEFAGTLRDAGLVPIALGRSAYLWSSAHVGSYALFIVSALLAQRMRPLDKAVWVTAAVAGVLAVAIFIVVITQSAALPALSVNGEFTPINRGVYQPVLLLLGLVTLVIVVGATRLRRWVDVYVALFVMGSVLETYLLFVGPRRFSLGWYGSRAEFTIASLVIAIALIRQVNLMYRQLTAENRRLARAAMVDPLTGVANRRAFDAHLESLTPNSVLLLVDIDHFKPYNDTEGHRAGDECLRRVARSLAANVLRSDDLIARYGGDEFAAILRDTELDDAIHVAERIRRAVAELAIAARHDKAAITVSIGAAAHLPGEDPHDLLRRADEALYRAKAGGRDRVSFDEEVMVTQE